MGKKLLRCFIKEESGQVLVLFALLAIVIFGITAFVTDVGMLQSHKRHLQNTADAAALAGARDLADGKDAANVTASVYKYVDENKIDKNEVKAIIIDDNSVKVDLKGSRGLFFARAARLTNDDSANVRAKAKAKVGLPSGMKGVLPIGIEIDDFKNFDKNGGSFIVKGNSAGNWGWVNLDYAYGNKNISVDEQAEFIINGYDKMLYINDIIETDNGANVQSGGHVGKWNWKVEEYMKNGTPLFVPIIDKFPNGKKEVTILGFASIIITDMGGKTSGLELSGKVNPDKSIFVGGVLNPDPDAEDFGLKTIALVE